MLFIYGLVAGVVAGGTLSYLYAQRVIAKVQAAASAVATKKV